MTALFAATASGQRGGETFLDNLWLGIPGIVAFGAALTSMITGLTAVLVRRERGPIVVTTAITSTLVSLFVALSLIFG